MVDEGAHSFGEGGFIVVIKFDQVNAANHRVSGCREELRYAVPDEVLHGQLQHGVVDGLYGSRAQRLRLVL